MTKKSIKIALVACIVITLSAGVFAKSAYFSTSVKSVGTPVYPLTIETPEAILSWFKDQGLEVGNYSTDLSGMSVDYRNEVRSLYDDEDSKDEIDAIAQKELLGFLEEGSIEYVKTSYGPITWTVQFDASDEEA